MVLVTEPREEFHQSAQNAMFRTYHNVVIAGDYIRDKYDGATEVKVSKRGRLQLKDPRFSLPTAQDLVYLDDSPNYCLRNENIVSMISFILVATV